jgi:hypothetical protein
LGKLSPAVLVQFMDLLPRDTLVWASHFASVGCTCPFRAPGVGMMSAVPFFFFFPYGLNTGLLTSHSTVWTMFLALMILELGSHVFLPRPSWTTILLFYVTMPSFFSVEMRSCQLFGGADLESWSSWSQPPK